MKKKYFGIGLTAVIIVLSLIIAGCPSVDDGGGGSGVFDGLLYGEGLSSFLNDPLFWNGDNGFKIGDDTASPHDGAKALKVDWSSVPDWNGLAFPAKEAQNLSSYNALTFYAKGGVTIDKIGFAAGSEFEAYLENQAIPATWTKYTLPFPSSSKLTSVTNLFFTADGKGDVLYLDNIKFETLSPAPTLKALADPASTTLSIEVGKTSTVVLGTATMTVGGKDVTVTGKPDGNGVSGYATWVSADTTIATVDAKGVITGVKAGGPVAVTGSIGGITKTINVTITTPVVFNGVIYTDTLQNSFTVGTNSDGTASSNTSSTASFLEGSQSTLISLSGGTWGGGYFINATGVDASGFTNLVFSIDKSSFANTVDYMELKVESEDGNTDKAKSLNLFSYTPVKDKTKTDWETYTIPVSAFSADITLGKFKGVGFWHPKTGGSSGKYAPANFYLDDIKFTK